MKKGWRVERLGDVVETGAGGTPLKSHKEYYQGGTIPWLLSGEVSQGEIFEATNFITEKGLQNSSARLFPPNTVLIAMYGATAGQVGILRFASTTNQAVCGILPNDKFLPEFLYYCFLSKKDELISQAIGGAQPNISQIKIKNTLVPLPPLPEQERIVSLLDESFAALAQVHENAARNLVNAREVFEAVLEETFNKDGKDWQEEKLGEVCERITDGTHVTPKYVSKGVPFLSVKNLTKGFIDFSDTRFITPEEHKILTKRVRPERDDVLYTKVGTTGIAKVVDVDVEFSIFVSVALLKIKHETIYNKYLEYFLNSPFARQQAQKRTRGTANKNLVINDIKEIEIHFPKSLAEQRAIVQRLDGLARETRRLEEVYRQKVEDVDELRKSVLARVFQT